MIGQALKRVQGRCADAWVIPVESLGLWRLATGLILLAEWSDRIAHLDPLYLHEGLRRSGDLMRMIEYWTGPWPGEGVVALAAIGVVATTAWTIGWLTRWAQVWALGTFALFSQVNLMTGHAGDVLLIGLLFWSLPLRCGGAFSLDHFLRPGKGESGLPGAGLAVLGQVALVYGLAGLAKRGESWQTGEALYRALAGSLSSEAGARLALIVPDGLLAWIGRGLPWMELVIACLILCPWFRPWPRRAALLLTTVFQLSLAIGMNLGLLPWLMVATGFLLMQPEDWAWLKAQPAGKAPANTQWHRCALVTMWNILFLTAAFVSADGTLRRTWGWEKRLAPNWLWQPFHLVQLHQDWGMFAPEVRAFRVDYRVEVESVGGTVWALGDREESFLGGSGKGWRKFIEQAAGPRRKRERDQLLALAAREAARTGVDVRRVRLIRVTRPLMGAGHQDEIEQETLVGQMEFAGARSLAVDKRSDILQK